PTDRIAESTARSRARRVSRREAVLNPARDTLRSYRPAGRPARVNCPASFAATVRVFPVEASRMATLAPETTAPVGSVTVPAISARPLNGPGQTLHVRALALDRSNHEAAANRKLTFGVEDSRGNKVFKKATQTDKFGIAS